MDKFSLLYPQIVATKISIIFYHQKDRKKEIKKEREKREEKKFLATCEHVILSYYRGILSLRFLIAPALTEKKKKVIITLIHCWWERKIV